jgi:hypothetical protein
LAKGRSIALCQRAASVPRPFGLILPKAAVLSVAAGDWKGSCFLVPAVAVFAAVDRQKNRNRFIV